MIKPAFTAKELIGMGIPEKDINALSKYALISPDVMVLADWDIHVDNNVKSDKLAANIEKNGQTVSLQVRELEDGRFEIFDGKKRFRALKDKPFILCYNHGKISETEAKRIGLETDIRFDYDQYVVYKILKELSLEIDITELTQTLPFDESEINQALEMSFDIEPNSLPDAVVTLKDGFQLNFGELVASQYATFAMTFNFDKEKKSDFDEYLAKHSKAELTEAICQYVADHK